MEEAQEANAWQNAGAISLEEVIRMRRPDWDNEAVVEEAERIRSGGQFGPMPSRRFSPNEPTNGETGAADRILRGLLDGNGQRS